MLLTAVARSENTGQALLNNHSAIPERGRAPVLAEPVDSDVRIPAGRGWRAFPLSPQGRKRSALAVRREGAAVVVPTAKARSPWILLVAGTD